MNREEMISKIKSKKFSSAVTRAVLKLSEIAETEMPIARRQLANEKKSPHMKYRFSGWPEHGKEIFAFMVKFGKSYLTIHFADYQDRTTLEKFAASAQIEIGDDGPVTIKQDDNSKDRFHWQIKAHEDWLLSEENLVRLAHFVTDALFKYHQ